MRKKKKTVTLSLDWDYGPITAYDHQTGLLHTRVPIVDNDPMVRRLCGEISQLYDSRALSVSYDVDSAGFIVDEETNRKTKAQFYFLVIQLIARLEEINDGSFEIQPWIMGGLEHDVVSLRCPRQWIPEDD